MSLRYLLVARTGSGKHTFCKLCKNSKLTVAEYFTDDENCTFPFKYKSTEEMENSILYLQYTKNGHRYGIPKQKIAESNVIPIEPQCINDLLELFPNDTFRIINLLAENTERLAHAVADAEDKILAEEDFKPICFEENEYYEEFENKISDGKIEELGVKMLHQVFNDFTDKSDIHLWPQIIMENLKLFTKTENIVITLINKNILTGEISKKAKTVTISNTTLPLKEFVEHLILTNDDFTMIIKLWLTKT